MGESMAARSTGIATSSIRVPEQRVLTALGRYFYVTVPQVVRRSYSPRSDSFVRTAVKNLRNMGYIQAQYSDAPRRVGSSLPVYRLTKQGMRCLTDSGFEVDQRYHAEEAPHAYM